MPDKDAFTKLTDLLREGGMIGHPRVAYHHRQAMETGNSRPLEEFLNRNPAILAMARRNISVASHQKADNPFRPYPTHREAYEHLSGKIKLGYINEIDDQFGIHENTLALPVIIAGRVKSGKSVLIKRIVIQMIKKEQDYNIIVPDLKKEYRHLLPYSKYLQVLNKDRLKINPFQVPAFRDPLSHIFALAQVFISENYLLLTSLNEIVKVLKYLYSEHDIFSGSKNFPTIYEVYNTITSLLRKEKWGRYVDVLRWLQNRLFQYTMSESYNCRFGIPSEMFRKKNLVLEMDTGFTNHMYNFTVAYIAEMLYSHNKAKGLIGSKLRHLFVIDESRILFNAYRNISEYGESIMNEIASKCREFGEGFLLGSQESSSFNQTIRSNAFLKLAFPLEDGTDMNWVKESFGLDDDMAAHMYKLPPFGQAVVRYGNYEKPFILAVPPFSTKRYVTDEEVEDRMAGFYSELDKYVKQGQIQNPPEIFTIIPPAPSALLYFLGAYPFTKVSDMTKAPGFKSPATVAESLSWLEENQYVCREEYRVTKRGRKSIFAVLTDKAHTYLGTKTPKGKGSFLHTLYQHLTAVHLTKQGLKPSIEARIKKSEKAADVLVTHKTGLTAYEVTLHFQNLMDNIHQDFAAGATEVVVVTRDKAGQEKAMSIVEQDQSISPDLLEKVSFRTIDHFFE